MGEGSNPFLTATGIVFPYVPTGDKVFLWQELPEERSGAIYLPPVAREEKDTAEILAIGPGYYAETGSFIPTVLKVGQKVVFNKSCPWVKDVADKKGKKYQIRLCAEKDIWAVVN